MWQIFFSFLLAFGKYKVNEMVKRGWLKFSHLKAHIHGGTQMAPQEKSDEII
jgi:hypothetical protein